MWHWTSHLSSQGFVFLYQKKLLKGPIVQESKPDKWPSQVRECGLGGQHQGQLPRTRKPNRTLSHQRPGFEFWLWPKHSVTLTWHTGLSEPQCRHLYICPYGLTEMSIMTTSQVGLSVACWVWNPKHHWQDDCFSKIHVSLLLWISGFRGMSSKFLSWWNKSPIFLVPLKEQFDVIKVFRVEQLWLWILTLMPISCASLGKQILLPEPQFCLGNMGIK